MLKQCASQSKACAFPSDDVLTLSGAQILGQNQLDLAIAWATGTSPCPYSIGWALFNAMQLTINRLPLALSLSLFKNP